MNGWTSDKAWSDQYMPAIKRILGEHLIGAAPQEDDQERNTDLIVLRMEAVRIGCRMRRFSQIRYADEFTIRADRPSGAKTELAKIIEGWGNYFFYGFAAETEVGALSAWLLGDLNVFRLWFNRFMAQHQGRWPGIKKPNKDGSSSFLCFCIDDLPTDFILARC